jgi:hypothetical protein
VPIGCCLYAEDLGDFSCKRRCRLQHACVLRSLNLFISVRACSEVSPVKVSHFCEGSSSNCTLQSWCF